MSIPKNLQVERTNLQRENWGSWRWWSSRGAGTFALLMLTWVNRELDWSVPVMLALWAGSMLLCWFAAYAIDAEQKRIRNKESKGCWGGWTGIFISLGFAMALSTGSWSSKLLTRNSATFLSLAIFGIVILAHEQSEAAKRASFDLLEAREQALRAKLAPHFIFNTLNTLHAQIDQDPRGAQATTERLAQLFRQVIEASGQLAIPLKQELAFVEAYLGIEQARLGDRLRVAIAVPEELESAEVPPLSLQVLVENAIKHGVAPLEQGGEVRIGAERQNGVLTLWVEDPGTGSSPEKGTGTALDTLRQRLERPEDLEMGMLDGRHRVGFRWRQA